MNSKVPGESLFSAIKYKTKSATFAIPAMYLEDSGLIFPEEGLVLYCRKDFAKQLCFLKDNVMRDGALGWILGTPGCGKSSAAFAFLTSELDNAEWIFTWIHLGSSHLSCIRFVNNEKTTLNANYRQVDLIKNYLHDDTDGKKHFLFLDGYCYAGPAAQEHKSISDVCENWRAENIVDHRLSKVCSMSTRGKTKLDEDRINNVQISQISSWTLEEYHAAFRLPAIARRFEDNLDASFFDDSIEQSTAERVEAKYYFAGGCARYMFSCPTNLVLANIEEGIAACVDISPYLTGSICNQLDSIINCLLCNFIYEEGNVYRRKTSLVSSYAASEVAMKQGPDLIQRLAKFLKGELNPVLQGFLFEMWFFALIRFGDINLEGKRAVTFRQAVIIQLDPSTEIRIPASREVWFKPRKWNQGGYDAVHVDYHHRLVTFFQVSRSRYHSLKLEFFSSLMRNLVFQRTTAKNVRVEIIFVVPNDQIHAFTISEVTGSGLLAAYSNRNKVFWAKGCEKELVEVMAVTRKWD